MKRLREDEAVTPTPTRRDMDEKNYFAAYSDYAIHETMLRDEVRTNAYRNGIRAFRKEIENKVVLDVGGGTGILSIFAAREGGARKVYCVDASEMAGSAKLIIEANKFSNVIEVIKGKIEEIELPEKVDVIISEWMGYFLLYESMLDSVLFARDKWLKPDGIILPSKAELYISPICFEEFYDQRVSFWNEIKKLYDVDMSIVVPMARKELSREVLIDFIPQEAVMSNPEKIFTFDIKNGSKEDLEFSSEFECKSILYGELHGFTCWFNVFFGDEVELSTSPAEEPTHWKQVSFFLTESFLVHQDDKIKGKIFVKKNPLNNRFIDVVINHQTPQTQELSHSYSISDCISNEKEKS